VIANVSTGSATGEETDTITTVEDLIGSALADTLIGDAPEKLRLWR
jgi:hypothetical protein